MNTAKKYIVTYFGGYYGAYLATSRAGAIDAAVAARRVRACDVLDFHAFVSALQPTTHDVTHVSYVSDPHGRFRSAAFSAPGFGRSAKESLERATYWNSQSSAVRTVPIGKAPAYVFDSNAWRVLEEITRDLEELEKTTRVQR